MVLWKLPNIFYLNRRHIFKMDDASEKRTRCSNNVVIYKRKQFY